jgi:hypothetical protein
LLVLSPQRLEAEEMPKFIAFNQQLAKLLAETAS